jgi:hypothetical protein
MAVTGITVAVPIGGSGVASEDRAKISSSPYQFSKTLRGECPSLSGGTLTLRSDGTLLREHKTPDFAANGTLQRKS